MAAADGVDMQLDRICTERVGVLYQKTVGGQDSHAVGENMQYERATGVKCCLIFGFKVCYKNLHLLCFGVNSSLAYFKGGP